MGNQTQAWQREFLQRHQLDQSYLFIAEKWFEKILFGILAFQADLSRPVLIAVNGCQGSGKSTLCDYLVASLKFKHQCSAINLSLDDFYLRREERVQLSEKIHPLLATRGVPGTHDITLLEASLDSLCNATSATVTAIPRFDKASDDRKPDSDWDYVEGVVDVIFLEGWCLGAMPETVEALSNPINALEQREDKEGTWRTYANRILRDDFTRLYGRVDLWLMLQAPSFDCVYRWRREQEQKLASTRSPNSTSRVMEAEELTRFIQFYQRLTENCLRQLPDKIHYLYQLGENREVLSFRQRPLPRSLIND